MNYYKQGDGANADKIKAAFEKLGYDTSRHLFNAKSVLYFTLDGGIRATTCNCTPAIIKTHPDYKELELPKPHYDIANYKPFDKVLVRCSNDEEWMIEFYCKYDTLVHTSPHRDYPFMGIGDSYSQCVPFEGNEHLLGTTDMCPEEFINW
jgi:hypothetical protein